MKTKHGVLLAITLIAAVVLLVSSKANSGSTNEFKPENARVTRKLMGVKPVGTNEVDSEAALWRDINQKLYYGKVVADASMTGALLKRMDQGDFETVKHVLLIQLKVDLQICETETNYLFADEEQKALEVAKQYLKQKEATK